jgi:hypothetical protein
VPTGVPSKNYAIDFSGEFLPQEFLQVSTTIAINRSLPYEFGAQVALQTAPKNTVTHPIAP